MSNLFFSSAGGWRCGEEREGGMCSLEDFLEVLRVASILGCLSLVSVLSLFYLLKSVYP